MPRKERIEVAQADHSLAAFNAREDERLKADAASSTMKAKRAIAEASVDGPREIVAKPVGDELAMWPHERAVARAMAGGDERVIALLEAGLIDRDRRSFRGQGVTIAGGGAPLGVHLERIEMGVGQVQRGTNTNDARAFGTGHYAAAWTIWLTLSKQERQVLAAMFGDVATEHSDRGPRHMDLRAIAAKVNEAKREGAIGAARHALADVLTRDQVGALDLEQTITPTQLCAIRLGRLKADATPDEKQNVTSELAHEVKRACRVFRDRLRTVDLNEPLSRLQDATGIPRERKPLLIPPATLASRERERAVETVICIGPIAYEPLEVPEGEDAAAWIAANPRPTCDVERVVADASSWARCAACGRPRR